MTQCASWLKLALLYSVIPPEGIFFGEIPFFEDTLRRKILQATLRRGDLISVHLGYNKDRYYLPAEAKGRLRDPVKITLIPFPVYS